VYSRYPFQLFLEQLLFHRPSSAGTSRLQRNLRRRKAQLPAQHRLPATTATQAEVTAAYLQYVRNAARFGQILPRLFSYGREVISVIANSRGLSVADLVLVQPGSTPITISHTVRRAVCVKQYRRGQFARLHP
jgi:hypothetical protein